MNPKKVERRKYARLDLALTVSYRVAGQSGTQPVNLREAVSSDISAGGLRLMTPSPLENGTVLELELLLGDQELNSVRAEGEVVWQNKLSETSYETGVRIKGMPDASAFKQINHADTQNVYVTANGLTPLVNGFTVGTDADLNTAAETIFYEVSD